jgi:hypothetical protein
MEGRKEGRRGGRELRPHGIPPERFGIAFYPMAYRVRRENGGDGSSADAKDSGRPRKDSLPRDCQSMLYHLQSCGNGSAYLKTAEPFSISPNSTHVKLAAADHLPSAFPTGWAREVSAQETNDGLDMAAPRAYMGNMPALVGCMDSCGITPLPTLLPTPAL